MKRKTLKNMVSVLAVMLMAVQFTACTGSAAVKQESVQSQAVSNVSDSEKFEKGSKVTRGAVKIVDLYGTWREMGRQYGKLMSAELHDVYSFTDEYVQASEDNQKKAEDTVKIQTNQNMYTIREFIAGASETSGLSEEQLNTANAVERIASLPKCSAAVVWGDYAKDSLVAGRNYDYAEFFKELCNDVAVTVYHPADGSLATATIGYAGEIYAVNALNEKGIFMELNNGKPSADIKPPTLRNTGTSVLFDMMFEADSLDYTDLFFDTAACSSSYIINMADSSSVRSYEWCPVGVKRGDGILSDGLLVSTNHYLNPEWSFSEPSDEESWMSITRRNNLIDLCEQNKGEIDAQKMMNIISTSIEDGGAKNDMTVYQIVVVPESLTLWLNVADSADWTEINMKSFLLSDSTAK